MATNDNPSGASYDPVPGPDDFEDAPIRVWFSDRVGGVGFVKMLHELSRRQG